MTTIATYLFLVGMVLAAIPHIALFWFLARSWTPTSRNTTTLGRTLYWLTLAQIIFYFAQFTTVFLGVLGMSMDARVPIILMVDGSLLLIGAANWYTFWKVWQIQKDITS